MGREWNSSIPPPLPRGPPPPWAPLDLCAYSAPVAAARLSFLESTPLGQVVLCRPCLGNFRHLQLHCGVPSRAHILMHPFHMLGVAVSSAVLCSRPLHGSRRHQLPVRETYRKRELRTYAYKFGQEEETYKSWRPTLLRSSDLPVTPPFNHSRSCTPARHLAGVGIMVHPALGVSTMASTSRFSRLNSFFRSSMPRPRDQTLG